MERKLTHEEEMKILRAETAKAHAEALRSQAMVEKQLQDIIDLLKK